jgi:osmotically-inducible protein OsmY
MTVALAAPVLYADDYAATGNPADLNVTDAIKMKIDGDTGLSRDHIMVITTDTAVLLKGTVASKDDADRAQRYAQAYAGDHQVQSELVVSGQ